MGLKERFIRFRSFWIFPLLAAAALYVTFTVEHESRFRDLAWLFPLGLLTWTALEYGMHRFIFHIRLQNRRLRFLLNASHHAHHAAPRDPSKVLVNPLYGLAISIGLFSLLYLSFGRLWQAAGVMAGIWAGFLYYETVHYRVHLTTASSGLIARQRRAHFYHHFVDSQRCFGVTNPFWDYVFRTAGPQRIAHSAIRNPHL
jgi:sterol desaturase/sphingolipid hydroxylase (fatty acid hydroxylase superfamily)